MSILEYFGEQPQIKFTTEVDEEIDNNSQHFQNVEEEIKSKIEQSSNSSFQKEIDNLYVDKGAKETVIA